MTRHDEPLKLPGDTSRPVTSRPMTPLEQRKHDDLHWAATAPEVLQHEGKLVVIRNKRVIAVGLEQRALLEQAASQELCPWWEFVVEVVPGREFWETPTGVRGKETGSLAEGGPTMKPTPGDPSYCATGAKRAVTSRPLTPLELRISEDFRWAATAPEVQQHPGKFVAVHNKRVVVVGMDPQAVREQAAAREGCSPEEFAVIVVPGCEFWEEADR